MELGALVCVPNGAPLCGACPLRALCAAQRLGTAESLPRKAPPAEKKLLHYTVVLVLDGAERVLLQQRAQTGLLAGLWQPILLEGVLSAGQLPAALDGLGLSCESILPLQNAKHIFTHLVWQMNGFAVHTAPCPAPPGCVWAARTELEDTYTLPNAFKVYRAALKNLL